jgi:signal transduction histidine kinase
MGNQGGKRLRPVNDPSRQSDNTKLDRSANEAATLAERLAFLQLDEADAMRLRALAPMFDHHAAEFVEVFYNHLFAFAETERFLRDPDLVRRLKRAQQSHFESMLAAKWDEEYAADRRRVGDVHAQEGIEPQFFLGAYNQYLQFYFQTLADSLPGISRDYLQQIGSLIKAVLLDTGLTLDAYFGQSTAALRNALDMLWQANNDLRQFAQLASHDLKTPLATVANLCDEALDEFGPEMPPEARRLIEAARNRTFRMSATIDELLSSTSSIHSGGALGEASIEQALTEAIEQVRPLLDERHIQLSIPSEFPTVLGDQVRIREALYNLLSNAAKFIDKQPGRITVEVETRDAECVLVVADNGPGIPHDELERIFVPFRRLPMHRDRPGSGLGLYFTKNLIEQQGGRVWAESELEQGSRFYVVLKRAD